MEFKGLIDDYSEWSGIPRETVIRYVQNFQEINIKDYYSHSSEEEFYTESKTYIYDIIGASDTPQHVADKLTKFIPGIMTNMKVFHGEFLDFGGGTGVLCEWIARNTDMNVTYFDLKGYVSDFAIWRFKKYNLPIEIVYAGMSDFELPRTYDVVFSDAVWEHLDTEMQIRYAEKLPKFINKGGTFFLLIDLSGENPKMPMHYNVNIQKVHDTISKQMKCIYGLYNFASVWSKT